MRGRLGELAELKTEMTVTLLRQSIPGATRGFMVVNRTPLAHERHSSADIPALEFPGRISLA